MGVYWLVTKTHGQEDVATPDDGLVGVIGIEMQTAADEYPRENIAGCGNALSSATPIS